MTRFSLVRRNLSHFRGVNLALIAGMLVATAVLTGALAVGDSVRGSLAQLARQRLGRADDALLAGRFFSQALVERLAADPKLSARFDIAPAVILTGGASSEDESVRAGAVQILAVGGDWAPVPAGNCILNGPTADAMNLTAAGSTILLSLPDKPDEPREAALSRRSREDTLADLRANVSAIHRARDMISLFNPQGGQRVPQNAWVNLPELQDRIDTRGWINTILVHDRTGGDSASGADLLNQRLREDIRLEDYGLSLAPAREPSQEALTSTGVYLDPPVVAAAEATGIPLQRITINLLTSVRVAGTNRQLAYVVAAGVSPLEGSDLKDDEVAINQWTADHLGAKVGDRITLTYYRRDAAGDLMDVSGASAGFSEGFRVARILSMTGIGADRSLTPNYKGLTDADTIADWNPPEGVEIDRKRVTPADEAYWHQYRAAPKLFLSFATARKLWGGPTGGVTSLRIPAARAAEFRAALGRKLDPAAMGLNFQPILARQLAAASGSTDFGQYFLYFSFFIIVAAVLLVAMLFRLNIEQRARQMGILSAVGWRPRALRRTALQEGMILAAIGGLPGVPASLAYTWVIMYGLRTWWIGAVGTAELRLHVEPLTLVIGYASALIVAFFAILWAVWHVGRAPTAALLAGGWGSPVRTRRSGRILRIVGFVLILIAIATFASTAFGRGVADEAFLGGGTTLLIGCLIWLGGAMRPRVARSFHPGRIATVGRLGVRNASRHTARSVLAVGLIAFAAFTLITVAAMKQGEPNDTADPASGAGGYRLILTSGIPLLGDLNTPQGRRVLGMTDADEDIWQGIHFAMMRRQTGQDISCLNLTQPTTPAILSVPPEMTAPIGPNKMHRFTFAQVTGSPTNPWDLLNAPEADDRIPVITDDNTAQYILKVNLGGTIDVPDAAGRTRHLQLVATLSNSVFQSELLMSEANFRTLFPARDGFGVALVECPADRQEQILRTLNTQLGEYSADTRTTASRLAQYLTIQNTYLSTFQALGALGLMLGSIGLAVVLVRTVIERKPELALLACLGFRHRDRVRLVLSENIFLLLVGLVTGTICALLGVMPAVLRSARGINFPALGLMLLAVFVIGAGASLIASRAAGLHMRPDDLRRE